MRAEAPENVRYTGTSNNWMYRKIIETVIIIYIKKNL